MNIECRHCQTIYKEEDEGRHTTHATWHEPGEDIPYCPACNENAEDNQETNQPTTY